MLKILLTNDDGIYAPGLRALYEELKDDHEVMVVAPEIEMSAVGHAITLNFPLRVKKLHINGQLSGYAVSGTPADCVKIGVQELMEAPPDIILSGINLGANVGVNVLYSGTVSAATEGAFLGIKSASISLNTRKNPDFTFAARFSRDIIDFIMKADLALGTALNVNIPALPPERIKGVKITKQGTSRFVERFEQRTDPRGNTYYWLTGERFIENGDPENDSFVLSQDMITITPLHYDLTCHNEFKRLSSLLPESWKSLHPEGYISGH